MRETVGRILASIDCGDYELAYRIGSDALSEAQNERAQILRALCKLSARLRSVCMELAVQKKDFGKGYVELDALLRKVNLLTGQDMYGRVIE